MSRRNKLIWFLVGLFVTGVSYTASQYIITNGSLQMINEQGVCRDITNNAGQSIFVPTNSAAEWCGSISGCTGSPSNTDSFLKKTPSGVVVCTTCGAKSCVADTDAEGFVLADTTSSAPASVSHVVTSINQPVTFYFEKLSGTASATVKLNGASQGTLTSNLTVSNIVEGDTIALEIASCPSSVTTKVSIKYNNSGGSVVTGNGDVDLTCSPGGVWTLISSDNCVDTYGENCTPYNTCGYTSPSGQSCPTLGATCAKATFAVESNYECD